MDSIDDQAGSNLREYLQVLRRRQWTIILVTAIFLGLSIAYSVVTTPVYEGTVKVLLTPQLSSTLLQANDSSVPLIGVDVPTATQVFESKSVSDYVEQSIPNVPAVSVTQVGTTDVVNVTVESTNKVLAAKAANAYANGYIHLEQEQTVNTINGAVQLLNAHLQTINGQVDAVQLKLNHATAANSSTLNTQLQGLQEEAVELQNEISNDEFAANESSGGGQIVSSASVPTKPVKPKKVEYAVVAVLLGLAVGVGLAMMLDFFDNGIRTKEDVERVAHNNPVLALIPEVVDWRDSHAQYLVSRSSPNSIPAEAYRSLRTSVQFIGLDRAVKTVQFTSPSAAEGKTTTLANLAVVMAQAGQRVVVVCCDLRRPRLHEFFNVSNQVGFTSVLLGEATLGEALQSVPGLDNLRILASGRIPPNPSELLSGARTQDVLATLSEQADVVLIDSPPVLPVTDAAVLAGRVDSVIMVVAAGVSTQGEVERAVEILARVEAPISGLVLNRASDSTAYAYYHYAYGGPVQSTRRSRRESRQAAGDTESQDSA